MAEATATLKLVCVLYPTAKRVPDSMQALPVD